MAIDRLAQPLRLRPFLLLLSALLLSINAYAQDNATKNEGETDETALVVYHADFKDPRRFSAMLTSINNMINTYQQDLREYDIRIVFVSYGIRFVTEDPLKGTPFAEDPALKQRRTDLIARLKSLQTQGVKLELCNITREQAHLAEGKIISGVELVPSGVVRVADLEDAGYAYIKIE
jgi:intracellular sulfur oxidation DsrE/DsrF family protein